MGKPSPDETTAIPASAPAAATSSAVVVKAADGKWPDPPYAGRWSRDPATGDLTLVEAAAQAPTPEQRRARRDRQRDAALKAGTTNSKE
jgi:hypothetical protein